MPGAEYRRDYRCCKPCCAARHVLPPRICLALCNSKQLFHFSYARYIENQIRETFGLEGTPVRIVIRERGEKV